MPPSATYTPPVQNRARSEARKAVSRLKLSEDGDGYLRIISFDVAAA